MSALILYQYDECYYCQRVDRAVQSLGIRDKIEYRNVRKNASFRSELLALNGSSQVPCLVIDGKPMLESADIVDWLTSKFGKA